MDNKQLQYVVGEGKKFIFGLVWRIMFAIIIAHGFMSWEQGDPPIFSIGADHPNERNDQ